MSMILFESGGIGNFEVITQNIQFCYISKSTSMQRVVTRRAARKGLAPSNLPEEPQQKKGAILKNKIVRANNPAINQKAQVCSQQYPTATFYEKENINRSEEETRVTEDDSESWQESDVLRKQSKELKHYKEDIMKYVLEREEKFMVDPGYLRNHHSLTARVRGYLVRHIFKVGTKQQLKRTTIYLAVHYMDSYFATNTAINDHCMAATTAQACLLIAMKYEEIYPPELSQWVDMRQQGEIIKTQAEILKSLNFQLAQHTLMHFLEYSLWDEAPEGSVVPQPTSKTLLLMDLSLFDMKMRQFRSPELVKCLRWMGQRGNDHKTADESLKPMVQNVLWMIERNADSLNYLLTQRYPDLTRACLD